MARLLSIQILDNFFKDLAEKHVDIKDYCGGSLSELSDKITSIDGVQSPILIFYDYSGKLEGPAQRTFNARSIAFSIAYSGIDTADVQAQLQAEADAEFIGLEILSRINVLSKMPETGWLYNNFIKESVTYVRIEQQTGMDFYGMEFHFDLKTHEPMTVDKAKWSDGDIFCSS